MPDDARAALRRRLDAVGRVKQASVADDARAHLALPLGERLLASIRLGDAHIRAFPAHLDDPREEEAEAWRRVRRRLMGR